MSDDALHWTRRSLHAVAEYVLAGPQYRTSGSIELRVRPGGFGTHRPPELAVAGGHLLAGAVRLRIDGRSARALAQAAGVQASALADVYPDGSGVLIEEQLDVDEAAARRLCAAFELGDAALRAFAPQQRPVLWPEHFDVAVRVQEVNYGVSPGDGFLDEPYAYVGIDPVPTGGFWNAPFGAARPVTELVEVDALVAWFGEGRRRAGH